MTAPTLLAAWTTARRWLTRTRALVIGVCLVVLVAYCAGRHEAPSTDPLPKALAERVEFHALQSAVDTARVHQLARTADSLRATQRRDSLHAAQLARAVVAARHRADSLAAVASQAATVHDSADAWHAAYDARTVEADTLRSALAVTTSALTAATQRGDALAAALVISNARAGRADSVVAATVQYARTADPPCRMLRVLACPSRTTAAISGALVGAAAVAVLVHLVP